MAHHPASVRKSRKQKDAVVPISEARRRLFELAEDVWTGRRESVALSHRDHDDQLRLVRAKDLDKLKADLAASRRPAGEKPFSLYGVIKFDRPAEEILREVRERQNRLFDEKMARIFGPADDGPTGDRGDSNRPASDAP